MMLLWLWRKAVTLSPGNPLSLLPPECPVDCKGGGAELKYRPCFGWIWVMETAHWQEGWAEQSGCSELARVVTVTWSVVENRPVRQQVVLPGGCPGC